jgi:hypothetical protein
VVVLVIEMSVPRTHTIAHVFKVNGSWLFKLHKNMVQRLGSKKGASILMEHLLPKPQCLVKCHSKPFRFKTTETSFGTVRKNVCFGYFASISN